MWLQVTPPNRRLCLENNQLICTSVGDKKQLQLPVSEVILFLAQTLARLPQPCLSGS